MERISTYIAEFDKLIGGGIPSENVILVAGTSGTMKSSLTYYILYQNALSGRKSLYITLEQDKESLLQQMQSFGMEFENVKDNLFLLDRKDAQKGMEKLEGRTFLQILFNYLKKLKKERGYELLGIDCLSVIEITAKMRKPRFELFRFFECLRTLGITSFLISEMSPDKRSYGKYDEDFLSDGIIHLKMERITDAKVQRRIRCVKIRNTRHDMDWYALLFDDNKFQVTKPIT